MTDIGYIGIVYCGRTMWWKRSEHIRSISTTADIIFLAGSVSACITVSTLFLGLLDSYVARSTFYLAMKIYFIFGFFPPVYYNSSLTLSRFIHIIQCWLGVCEDSTYLWKFMWCYWNEPWIVRVWAISRIQKINLAIRTHIFPSANWETGIARYKQLQVAAANCCTVQYRT